MISYVNNKGRRVSLEVKRHAVFAFRDRFENLFGTKISCTQAEHHIEARFPATQRVRNINHKEKGRIKRHGHSLYFRDGDFTYVVTNGVLITVEISRKGARCLN
jgi:hypothetical protein